MSGIIIRELCIRGDNNIDDASIKFKKGVNVVSGPSNTGKSFIYELIEYMLGKTELTRRINESIEYNRAYLEFEDSDRQIYTLASDLNGGNFDLYNEKLSEINNSSNKSTLKRKHISNNRNCLSSFILEKCNLKNRFVRVNANGKTRELSLRDLRNVYLANELKITTIDSPFFTGHRTSKTSEESVLKLLLTGVGDSPSKGIIDQKTIATNEGKLVAIQDIIDKKKGQLDLDVPKNELLEQQKKLSEKEILLKSKRDELIEQLNILNKDRLYLAKSIYNDELRIDELKSLYTSSLIIEQQYISDIERLKATIEAGNMLSSMSAINCPICHSEMSNDTTGLVKEISLSATAEYAKIRGLLNELSSSQKVFIDELAALQQKNKKEKNLISSLESSINEDIQVSFSNLNINLDLINEKKRSISSNINMHESLEYLLSLEVETKALVSTLSKEKIKYTPIGDNDLKDISNNMFNYLKKWGYPGITSVSYDESTKDFIISGEPRNLAGKGFRAISYSAFLLSLMDFGSHKEYSLGFCMIDSPLVTYRKPDVPVGECISENMANNFYSTLHDFDEKYQVIIFENEDVPYESLKEINHIHFTKNVNVGRYGFIPLK